MELVADRFLTSASGSVLDVGTGARVLLRVTRGVGDERRWTERCATLLTLRHPHLVTLVDYGQIGPHEWFEAFELPTPWQGSRRDPRVGDARRLTGVFFERLALSADLATCRPMNWRGRPAFVPGEGTGEPRADSGPLPASLSQRRREAAAGIVLQPCSALKAIGEWLDSETSGCPRTLALRGPHGSGLRTALQLAVRDVRVRGFVPVSSGWFEPASRPDGVANWIRRLVSTRHVVVIHDETNWRPVDASRDRLGRILLRIGSESQRVHALLVACRSDREDWPTIEMAPFDAARFVDMMRAADLPRHATPSVVQALARRHGGRPGPVIDRLLGTGGPRRLRRLAEAVAEASPPYRSASEKSLSSGEAEAPPLASAHVRARRDAVEGWRLATIGRHAAAERLLRQSMSGLVRRGDHPSAGEAALNLARLLITRGRLRSALDTLALAERTLECTAAHGLPIAVGVLTGVARTDLGQLDDAERILRSAWLASSQHAGRPSSSASTALARCLFWQHRFDEARKLVAEPSIGVGAIDSDPDTAVMSAALLARIELARRDVHAAGLAAQQALDRAGVLGRPFETAMAMRSSALVHAASSDLDAMATKVRHGLEAARRAHAPLIAIRLRAIQVRAFAAAGRSGDARRSAQPLRRLRLTTIAPPLAAHIKLALEEADRAARGGRGCSDEGNQAGQGTPAAAAHEPLAGPPRRAAVIDDVIDVLYLCQRADDEPAALGRVGGMVRERMRAASVAFLAVAGDNVSVLAACGQQPAEWPTALRAVQSGALIKPARREHGIEAAVPIRYGQSTVGALACRWTAEGPPDASRAEALLSATAVACAPWVQGALDRQVRVSQMVVGELRLLGVSQPADELRHATARAAAAPFPVLIEGESGSGKELVARAIHALGPRRDHRYCAVNCAALPDELLESELFGHARGAFTGAIGTRAGLFEEAHAGTLFLDEVGELSARAQAKLLRVLQEGEIRRIGENSARRVDVRVVAATNRSLAAEADSGRFRRDLLYRLDVVRIIVPPLRARVEDIAVLARRFWEEACEKLGSRAALSAATLAALARYDWPGNVRELQNVMAALAVAVPRRGLIGPSALPAAIARLSEAPPGATLEDARRAFEARYVRAALARTGGQRGRTARELGVTRQGLAKLLARLDIDTIARAQ